MMSRVFFLLLLTPCLYGAPRAETVVVFPFENLSGRSEFDWVSESFAEVLQSRLSSASPYALSREERRTGLGLLGLPASPGLTLASFFKVAQAVEADWAVTGDFQWNGDTLSARLQLMDMNTPRITSVHREDGKFDDLLDLQSRLAWSLLRDLDPTFRMEKGDFVQSFRQVRLDAFESLIHGLLASDWDAQVSYFTKAYQLDPHERRSAFELGRLYLEENNYAPSLEWLKKLEPGNQRYLEAGFLQGINYYRLDEYDKAEGVFLRLVDKLDAPEVHNNLGVLKARKGHHRDAIEHLMTAYRLEPDDADLNFNLALLLWKSNEIEQAARSIRECLRLRGDDAEAQLLQSRIVARQVAKAESPREPGEARDTVQHLASDPQPAESELEARIMVEYNPRPFRRPGEDVLLPRALFRENSSRKTTDRY